MGRFLAKAKRDLQGALKKGALDIVAAGVVNKVLVLMTTLVVIWLLSKEDYGVFGYAYKVINLVSIFASLGMNAVMLQYAAEQKDPEKRKYVYKYTFLFGAVTSVIVATGLIVYTFVSGYLGAETLKGANSAIREFSFIVLVQFMFQSVVNYYRAELNNKKYRLVTNVNSAAYFVFASLGAWLFAVPGTIIGRYLGFIVSVAAGVLWMGPALRDIFKAKKYDDFDSKGIISYGLTVTLTNAVSQILISCDVLLVGMIIKDSLVVADYQAATVIPFALAFIPQLVVTFVYPYFARNNQNMAWIKRNLIKMTGYLGIINLVICAGGVLLAPYIIRIFGKDYVDSATCVNCFRILMVSYFFSGTFRTVFGNVLFILHKVKANLVIGVVSSVLNIALDILLILKWGSIGAAIATASITVLDSVLSGAVVYRHVSKNKNNAQSE